MFSSLYEKTYYTAPHISYLSSVYIREYDMSKANISVLYTKGALSEDEFNFYSKIPSMARKVQLGLFLRDNKQFVNILKEGIREYRRMFFEENEIQDWEILSIKNDAIFLINKIPKATKFSDAIEFKHKNTYTSFYKLNRKFNKEFYYFLDTVNGIENLDIKGLGKDNLYLHKDYMIDFLLTLFSTLEVEGIGEALELIKSFYDAYISERLDLGFYRRFDSNSGYDTMFHDTLGNMYNMKFLSEEHRKYIDISYNADMIRDLYKIVSGMYFNDKK